MDDFLEKKPKKHSDAALATAARFSGLGIQEKIEKSVILWQSLTIRYRKVNAN